MEYEISFEVWPNAGLGKPNGCKLILDLKKDPETVVELVKQKIKEIEEGDK